MPCPLLAQYAYLYLCTYVCIYVHVSVCACINNISHTLKWTNEKRKKGKGGKWQTGRSAVNFQLLPKSFLLTQFFWGEEHKQPHTYTHTVTYSHIYPMTLSHSHSYSHSHFHFPFPLRDPINVPGGRYPRQARTHL